jgi:hypothetical protein
MRGFSLRIALVLIALIVVTEANVFYCFAADYKVEVASVETGRMIGGTWRSSYYFFHTEEMSAKVAVRNNDSSSRTATIYVNAFDGLNQPFSLYVTNTTLSAGETKVLYMPAYIPKWAASGNNCYIKVTAKTLPEGLFSPENDKDFGLLSGIPSYLIVNAFSNRGTQACNANAWVDGDPLVYPTPVAVPLVSGTHSLKMQAKFFCFENGVEYTYEFHNWGDGSISNLRTVSLSPAMNMTVTAYYTRYRSLVQQR